MGVCFSGKEKEVKAKEKGKNENNEEKDKKENEDNKEKNNNEEGNQDKNLDEKNDTNKNKDAPLNSEITFIIESKDKEYTEVVGSNEKIEYLFTLINKYKINKFAEYDLLTEEQFCLSLKLNDTIGATFSDKKSVNLKMLYLGLDISINIRNEYEANTTLIGQPLFDLGENVGLLIFHKFENIFTCEVINNELLTNFNHLSSYCTCKNVLYICGGESRENKGTNNRNYISNFIQIDLFNTKSINEMPRLEEPRAWHSMIFLPPKFIFIVGGDTKTVEIFDLEKKIITSDSQTNEIRNECTLFCLNDSILYAFSGTSKNGNFLKNIERCNLRAGKRKWEIIKYSNDKTELQDCFYISSFDKNISKIILFAANENENSNYNNLSFEVNEEDENETFNLNILNSEVKIVDVCPEKFFYPINNNTSILVPLIGNHAILYSLSNELKCQRIIQDEALKKIYE